MANDKQEVWKSAMFTLRDRDTGAISHQVIVFDANAPCRLCGLPVNQASVSGTAQCGACDVGRPRRGAVKQERPFKSAWYNATDHWEFPTREEANTKMRELHSTGIEGWAHVVNPEKVS